MIPRRRSKRGPADSVMSLPDGQVIIQQGFSTYATKAAMSEREPDPGFQVRDRRGRSEDPMSPPEQPTPTPEPTRATEPARAQTAEASHGQTSHRQSSLVGLFMMLASVAAAALEGVPESAGGPVTRDLQQAAAVIDIRRLLREKTEGRRTPKETKVLDEVIYGLQLRYVEATRHPG